MSAANKNRQGNFGFPVVYILAIAVSLAVYTLGLKFRDGIAHGVLWAILCLAALLVLTGTGLLGSTLLGKKLSKRSVAETNADADARMERITQNPRREWHRLLMFCFLAVGNVILLWMLCLGAVFFYGASGLSTEWIVLDLIPTFFLTGLIGKFFRLKEQQEDQEPLSDDDFPKLYELVRSAAGDQLGKKKLSVRVLHGIPDEECNAAVVLKDKEITLWIGAVLLCVLDEAELKQVLLHEFAHMDKEDVAQNRLYNRVMGHLTADTRSLFGGFADMALSYVSGRLIQEGTLYFLFSSRQKEKRADHRAATLGDKQKQCSALAKINAHTLYIYENEPYDNLFASEEIPQHLMTDRAKDFRDALITRGETWRPILEHEIPSRVDTHPTFRQRWEALGCCDYSLEPAETESAFARECWAAAVTADVERASIPREQYDQIRKENYLDACAILEDFESKDNNPAPDELREPMLAYYRIGKPEKMETICDRILAEHDSPFSTAFAAYWKGILLLRRYDATGLGYLYRAIEANSNYIESGLQEIGRFCTMMGLEQELREYRSRAPELMQTKVDRSAGGICSKTKLLPQELPDGWLDRIRDFILAAGGDDLEAIYLVQECAAEDYTPSSFVLRFREDTPDDRIDSIYNRVFRLLDDWPEDYEFALYVFDASMEKPLAAVEGSCIYRKAE